MSLNELRSIPVYRVIFIALLALLDNLYSGALQISDCIVLYCSYLEPNYAASPVFEPRSMQ